MIVKNMESDIYKQKIEFFNEELNKIGRILSDLTDRTGALLTIPTSTYYYEFFISSTFFILDFLVVGCRNYYLLPSFTESIGNC